MNRKGCAGEGEAGRPWSEERIWEWVLSQSWYQTIRIRDSIITPGSTDSIERSKILDRYDLKGKRVLDIGCNSGAYSLEACRRGATHVVGIDIDDHRLHQARTLASIIGVQPEFYRADVVDCRAFGKFDVVLCFAVLTEVPDLLGSVQAVLDVTESILLLELNVLFGPRTILRRFARGIWSLAGAQLAPYGIARVRKTKRGWALAPDLLLLRTLAGRDFELESLGWSTRYELIELRRRRAIHI